MSMTLAADAEPVRAVLRLRTLSSSGLNPPQVEVIDRLQTLSESEDSPIVKFDFEVWGTSRGLTQTADRDPGDTRELVAEFTQWADAHEYTLQPAFGWRSVNSETDGERPHGQIVTPLITLAVYNETGERLQAVYPHADGDQAHTIHEGVEALESMVGPGDDEQSGDKQNEHEDPAVPLQ